MVPCARAGPYIFITAELTVGRPHVEQPSVAEQNMCRFLYDGGIIARLPEGTPTASMKCHFWKSKRRFRFSRSGLLVRFTSLDDDANWG
jgi:hypothetical protein